MGKKDASGVTPHSPEAERMILGALFAENQAALDVIDILKPDHFFTSELKTIFISVKAVVDQCGKVDCLSVADHLQAERKLESVGGIPFLASLSDGMPPKLNISLWLAILRKQSILREFQRIISVQADKIPEGDADSLVSETIEKLYEIDSQVTSDPETELEVYARYMRSLESGPVFRVRTGVANLDRVIGGFKPGELAIFTGGPGMGKSLMVGQLRTNACQSGYHSVFFSGEMKNERILSRRLTQDTGVILSHVDSAKDLGPLQYKSLIEAGNKMCSTCRFEDSSLTLGRIRRITRILKRTAGISVVFIDYDELVEVEGDDENDEQRNLVRALKQLGMDLNLVIVLVSQLRKPVGEDGYVPTLQSVYGSGAKIKHASYVVFVHRKFVATLEGDKTTAIFAVLKNREGNIGAIKDVRFNIHSLKFEDWDGKETLA